MAVINRIKGLRSVGSFPRKGWIREMPGTFRPPSPSVLFISRKRFHSPRLTLTACNASGNQKRRLLSPVIDFSAQLHRLKRENLRPVYKPLDACGIIDVLNFLAAFSFASPSRFTRSLFIPRRIKQKIMPVFLSMSFKDVRETRRVLCNLSC